LRTDEKPLKKINRKRRIIDKLNEYEAFYDDDSEIGEENGSKSETSHQNRDKRHL